MKNRTRIAVVAGTMSLLVTLLAWPRAAEIISTVKPEDVGLSSERLTRINEMMQRRIAATEITGGVTLVARKGRIAHFEAHGVMDLESRKPMTRDAAFRIASMTKPVTGVAVMMLLEEGKLRLTDPVSKFIPVFKDMKVAVALQNQGPSPVAGEEAAAPRFYTVPADREITIRDLLTHTSGLVSGPMSASEERKAPRKPTETLADYIPRLAVTPLEFQPGTRWSYSPQAGFDTLGRIVEVVSGQSFDRFLRSRVFDPLGMQDISFSVTDALAPRMPTVYEISPKGMQKSTTPNRMSSQVYFAGAGGLITTAGEYVKFGQMLLNGGELNGKRLLSPRTVELMASVHIPDTLPGRLVGEGYGLRVRVVNHHVAGNSRLSDGSFGWSGAYGTHFWVDPKEEIVAVLMIQTPVRDMRPEFENAVMQAIVN